MKRGDVAGTIVREGPRAPDSPAVRPCAAIDDPRAAELSWLMQRATRVLADDFDEVAQHEGLDDLRDSLVLSVTADGAERSQLEISGRWGSTDPCR